MRGRVARGRATLAEQPYELDLIFPGRFAGDPPAEFRSLLDEIAADVRPASLARQLSIMADADQRDLLPQIVVSTLLIWGELDERSPLSIAYQLEQAIPETKLITEAGHRRRIGASGTRPVASDTNARTNVE